MSRYCAVFICVLLMSGSMFFADMYIFGEQVEPAVKKWSEILLAEKIELPQHELSIEFKINMDLDVALEKAKKFNAPVYVELICPKVKGDHSLEKLLNENTSIRRFMSHFVKARFDNLQDIDARALPFPEFQDMDKLWWAWILAPDGGVYASFGGHEMDSDDSNFSLKALEETLSLVLQHHYNPQAKQWNVTPKAPKYSGRFSSIRELPGFVNWNNKFNLRDSACIRCHNAIGVYAQGAVNKGDFKKESDFYYWPYPEVVGFSVRDNDGLLVGSVEVKSPAEKAGMVPGDRVGAANGRRLFSLADLRAEINRLPNKKGKLVLMIIRDGKVIPTTLKLGKDWKKCDISWRKGIRYITVGASTGMAWVEPASDSVRKKRRIKKKAMALVPSFGRNPNNFPAYKAGLREVHVITSVNKKSPNIRTGGEFASWFKINFEKKDLITLTVVDAKRKKRKIQFKAN